MKLQNPYVPPLEGVEKAQINSRKIYSPRKFYLYWLLNLLVPGYFAFYVCSNGTNTFPGLFSGILFLLALLVGISKTHIAPLLQYGGGFLAVLQIFLIIHFVVGCIGFFILQSVLGFPFSFGFGSIFSLTLLVGVQLLMVGYIIGKLKYKNAPIA